MVNTSVQCKRLPVPIIPAETSNTRPNPQAHRARQLVHQGELSAARQALSAGPLAPGERSTLDELTDPNRRPQAPYQALDPALLQYEPPEPVDMPADLLLTNLRRARKAAAPGPSGLTAETLKLVLDDEEATQKFVRVAQRLASADLPPGIHQAMGLGRLIALQKPNGRVRGIVIGDLLRRLVSRCPRPTNYAKQIHQACLPHQYALSHTGRHRSSRTRPHNRLRTAPYPHHPVGRWDWCLRHHLPQLHASRPPRRA